VSNVSISGYDPTAAAVAQSQAAAQNDAMIASTIERGRQNLDALERSVIKDNTIFLACSLGEGIADDLRLEGVTSLPLRG
jgi:hypothetical protein